jgi:cysteine desulfurase
VNVGFDGAAGDVLVQALDLAGVSASTGAACTSGSVRPSSVLLALGFSAQRAAEAVRFSLGRGTTEEEIDELLRLLPGLVERVRRYAVT